MRTTIDQKPRTLLWGWAALGAPLLFMVVGFTAASPLFGYATEVRAMPVFWLTGGLVSAGLLYLLLPRLIGASERLTPRLARPLLWGMLAAGLSMRLVLFASEPVLEDDYQRYLWDGAVTAHGLNPYAQTPDAAKTADPESLALGRLAIDSGPVLGRINHPDLRTIYPPVAQGAFVLAHKISPWSLTGWRAVILALDMASVALLLLLMRDLGRSPLWAALYWWNPIVLKELFNSAHMDALVVPLVLGGLVLAIRKRTLAATACLTLAAGAKIWPLILLPLVWRGLLSRPKQLAAAVTIAASGAALFAWPILSAGLDPTSGFVAYASAWKTNSALFPVIEASAGWLTDALNPGLLARGLVVLALAGVTVWQSRAPARDAQDFAHKALILTAALFLLSPAQFPWYYLWVLPLLACRPVPGLLVLTATLPLYYSAFYFLSHQAYELFSERIVWLIWLPAWGLLLWEARARLRTLLRPLATSQRARGAA